MKNDKFLLISLICVCFILWGTWAETASPLSTDIAKEKAVPENGGAKKETEPSGQYQIIDTPFGPVRTPSSIPSASENHPEKEKNKSAEFDIPMESQRVLTEQQEPSKKEEDPKHITPAQEPPSSEASQKTKPEELLVPPESVTSDSENTPQFQEEDLNKTPIQPAVKTDSLVFNFDEADIKEVIRTIADLLDINYIIDPKVGGKVTIHTAGTLDRKELFPIFYQILEINGLTAVKQDNFYKIMPAKDAMRMPIASRSAMDGKKADRGKEMIIQMIPLNCISVDEMAKILSPFVSSDGAIVSHVESNTLLVVDRSDNIQKILKLVATFDANIFDRVNYRFYPLQYGDVASLSQIMNQMVVAYGSAFKTNMAFIPIERLNTLLVVGTNPNAFEEISEFIKNYDVPSQNAEPTIFVYPVKNGQAKDIAGLLNDIFQGKKPEKKDQSVSAGASRNPLGKTNKAEKKQKESESAPSAPPSPPAPPLGPASGTPAGGEINVSATGLRGEVKITADEYRNSLIIQATPSDFQVIKRLLAELDVLPRQVLIEAKIAEITLDDKTELGVEWAYKKGEGGLSTSLLSANAGRNGLTFTIGDASQWTAAMTALASQNKVNILSSPSVLASNGQPASIDISTEIPVATTSYQYTSTEDPLFSSDIEYRDTGVMLKVTPHINELGLVTMEIDQEVSEQADNVQVGEQNYPSFFKRSASTTFTVQSGQTIVIGGLIKETKSKGAAGVPWLVSVPVLNFLFGKTADSTSKTELIIMITPYVIAQPDEVDAVSMEFKSRLNLLFPELMDGPGEGVQHKDSGK